MYCFENTISQCFTMFLFRLSVLKTLRSFNCVEVFHWIHYQVNVISPEHFREKLVQTSFYLFKKCISKATESVCAKLKWSNLIQCSNVIKTSNCTKNFWKCKSVEEIHWTNIIATRYDNDFVERKVMCRSKKNVKDGNKANSRAAILLRLWMRWFTRQ